MVCDNLPCLLRLLRRVRTLRVRQFIRTTASYYLERANKGDRKMIPSGLSGSIAPIR